MTWHDCRLSYLFWRVSALFKLLGRVCTAFVEACIAVVGAICFRFVYPTINPNAGHATLVGQIISDWLMSCLCRRRLSLRFAGRAEGFWMVLASKLTLDRYGI